MSAVYKQQEDGWEEHWHSDFPQVKIKIQGPIDMGIAFYLFGKLCELNSDLNPNHKFNKPKEDKCKAKQKM